MDFLRRADSVLRLSSSDIDKANAWINDDIKPLPPHRRTWTTTYFVFFWALNNLTLYSMTTGSALVALGLSVWQAMISTVIARLIIAFVAVFNGWPGAEWHIGFTVISRYIWGMYGCYVQVVQRIILSAVWMAVQSWTGGICVSIVLSSIFPSFQHMTNTMPASTHMHTKTFIGWVIFNFLMCACVYVPVEKTKRAFVVSNAVTLVTVVGLTAWAVHEAGGPGPLLSAGATLKTSDEYGWGIVQGITSVIGSIAVGLSNQPDYSRFARRPGDQVMGQWLSIPVFGTVVPLLGCICASATQQVFGEVVWNPPTIAERILARGYTPTARAGCFFLGLGFVVAQLAINAFDNAFSGGMDFAGLVPRYLNIRRGAYLTLILSVILQPWQLLSTASVFLSVLGAYSVFLGPMCGIMITHYWLVCKRRIRLSHLYKPDATSIYWYSGGFNPRSFVAWIVGFGPLLPGFVHNVTPTISVPIGATHYFYLAYPAGFCVSAAVYYAICKAFPYPGIDTIDELDVFGTFTPEEARRLGITVNPAVLVAEVASLGDDSKAGKTNLTVVESDKTSV